MIPVTTASSQIDAFDHDYKPMSEKDRKNWLACKCTSPDRIVHGPSKLKQCHRQTDDPEKYDGAPASIQILGRRLEEEKLLSLAQVVVDALNDYKHKS